MIKEIPSAYEFENVGLSCMNDAWDVALQFVLELETFFDYVENYEAHYEEDMVSAFWKAAKLKLARAQATLQQGVEFLCKARIADISPYLLILNAPTHFPKNSEKKDLSFADFRTIDAQDLLKVHDTFAQKRLDKDFKNEFEKLRRFRNSIMHTVDKRAEVEVVEIIYNVLSMYKFFYPKRNWADERKKYLSTAPSAELISSDYAAPQTIREFIKVFKLIKPSMMEAIYGINKKQRWYLCPNCFYEDMQWELWPKSSQLLPNKHNSKTIKCYICDETHDVIRKECSAADCKGNVISSEHEICLTCGEDDQ